MAALNLEALVLLGVSARNSGANVNGLRLGNQVAAKREFGIVPSMRHPSPGYPRTYPPVTVQSVDVDTRKDGGAGRSPRHAGVPCSVLASQPATLSGGRKPTAATLWRLLETTRLATVGEDFAGCDTGLRNLATR
jgi:hypothetical protein